MTKITALTGLLLLAATAAFADCNVWNNHGQNTDADCFLLTSSLVTIAPTIVPSASVQQNRVVYVGMVREDAAEFVGSNAQEELGIMLLDVMNQVREKAPVAAQMSDLDLAKFIEANFN